MGTSSTRTLLFDALGLGSHLQAEDIVIDCGNSFYRHDIRRTAALKPQGIQNNDVGTSGGVWGLERGYCLMIGGEPNPVRRLDPIFAELAPGIDAAPCMPGSEKGAARKRRAICTAAPPERGIWSRWCITAPSMGLMAAYAEGLHVMQNADIGKRQQEVDAETAPLLDPEYYQYDLNLAAIAELWRRGSVIGSWLLDLTAQALLISSDLATFFGRVADSGEGRWTIAAAIDEAVLMPVLSSALLERAVAVQVTLLETAFAALTRVW